MATSDNTAWIFTDPTGELERFLVAYRPTRLSEEDWGSVAAEAIELVKRAGPSTKVRLRLDLQTLAAVGACLRELGRPLTLEEMLSDAARAELDRVMATAGRDERYRSNRRGALARLQAYHRGLPWRGPRRRDGARAATRIQPLVAAVLGELERHAIEGGEEGAALVRAVEWARRARAGDRTTDLPKATWRAARCYAERHGVAMTKAWLAAVVTYEVLALDEPVALLIARFHLTRRDLELGVTLAGLLPVAPAARDRELLRGETSQN